MHGYKWTRMGQVKDLQRKLSNKADVEDMAAARARKIERLEHTLAQSVEKINDAQTAQKFLVRVQLIGHARNNM